MPIPEVTSAKELFDLLKNRQNSSFNQNPDSPLEVETHVHEVVGPVFRIDSSIYFVGFWSNEFLLKFYNELGLLLWEEIQKRGLVGEP